MTMPSRRQFLEGALAGGMIALTGATAAAQTRAARRSLAEAIDLGRRLRRGEITDTAWQDRVEATLASCDVTALGAAIGLDALRSRARPVRRGASILRVPLDDELLGGIGREVGSDVKVFFVEAGRTDPPHCHFNLVAAHIVLEGRFRVRHYDRVGEDDEGVALRATRDRVIGPGEVTSISDHRENAHWHAAETRGVLLDVQQGRIDPGLPVRLRQMLDVEGARPLGDGSIVAPRLARATALRRYG